MLPLLHPERIKTVFGCGAKEASRFASFCCSLPQLTRFLWRDVEITDGMHRSSPPLFQKYTYLSFDFAQDENFIN